MAERTLSEELSGHLQQIAPRDEESGRLPVSVEAAHYFSIAAEILGSPIRITDEGDISGCTVDKAAEMLREQYPDNKYPTGLLGRVLNEAVRIAICAGNGEVWEGLGEYAKEHRVFVSRPKPRATTL